MSSKQISVFVVDDHSLIVEGLKAALQSEPDIEFVGSELNGRSCLEFFRKNSADVVLMDINLPDINGIDLCAELVRLRPGIKILGLSTFNQRSYVSKMMENGARGYILKNASADEIAEAIRQVYKGNIFMSKEAGDALYKNATPSVDEIQELTSREKEVLKLIVEGLTTPEIAEKLIVSHLTVSSHRRNLMAKLKAKNTATLMKIALENKLV